MQFLLVLAACVGSAFSQAAFIESPLPDASVAAGSSITVEVSRPVRLLRLIPTPR